MKNATLLIVVGLIVLCATSAPLTGDEGAGWGTIKGRIVWNGDTIPERKQIRALGNPPNMPLSDEWVIHPKNKGVRWTFVWLMPDKGKKLPIHPKLQKVQPATGALDQPATMMIEPHALALREGQELRLKNTSMAARNFRGTGSPDLNSGFNVVVPSGASLGIPVKADRLPIVINSDALPWVKGWVRVFDHPYFAVSDENGNFELNEAPAGTFNLMVWHGTSGWRGGAAGRNGVPITVKTGQTVDVGDLPLAPN